MKGTFNSIVDAVYDLPIDEKLELMNLLGKNISDERREEIYSNYLAAKREERQNKLEFSSDIDVLKKVL